MSSLFRHECPRELGAHDDKEKLRRLLTRRIGASLDGVGPETGSEKQASLGVSERKKWTSVHGQAWIQMLGAAGTVLVARITRRSRDGLGLSPGSAVFAQIKGVALV